MRDEVAKRLQGNWTRGVGRCLAAAILCASAFGLSGCKVFVKEEPPPCPRVSILSDASELTRFKAGRKDDTSIELHAKLSDYHGACQYNKAERQMTVSLEVGMDVRRGAALLDGPQQISYFVAVPNFFPFDGAKRVLPVKFEMLKGEQNIHLTDRTVEITFPVRNIKELERYEIFVGFQLNEAELSYNRDHHVAR